MSYVNNFRYGNRPNSVQRLLQGSLVNVAGRVAGLDGTTVHNIHDFVYDSIYKDGPAFGKSSLTNGKRVVRSFRRSGSRRVRILRRLLRKMPRRFKMYK